MVETSLESEPVAVPHGPSGKSVRSFALHTMLTALMTATPFPVLLPVVLLHAGVRLGRRVAWLAAAVGIGFGAFFIAFQVATGVTARSDYAYLLAMIVAVAVPSLTVLPMVQRGEPFGRVVLIALLFGTAGLFVTEAGSRAMLSFSPYADQIEGARKSVAAVTEVYAKLGVPASAVKRWADVVIFCMPASLVINIAAFFILSLILLGRLRGWRDAVEGRDLSLSAPYLFRNLAFPDWLLFAFIVGGVSPLMKGMAQHVGANILAVVVFLYLVQGLAIFRSLLIRLGAGFGMSLLAWGMLAFLTASGIAPLLLSMAGLFDSFFDFRHFTKRKDDSDESHSD